MGNRCHVLGGDTASDNQGAHIQRCKRRRQGVRRGNRCGEIRHAVPVAKINPGSRVELQLGSLLQGKGGNSAGRICSEDWIAIVEQMDERLRVTPGARQVLGIKMLTVANQTVGSKCIPCRGFGESGAVKKSTHATILKILIRYRRQSPWRQRHHKVQLFRCPIPGPARRHQPHNAR